MQFHQTTQIFPKAWCIGGKYLAWFKGDRPHWWPNGWGEMTDPRTDCGPITVASLSGGIFAIKKSALANVGFFDPKLGQHGNVLRYGEEVQVQARLLEADMVLIYNPHMLIDHLVADMKHKIGWHLKAAYTHGINFWLSQDLKRPQFYTSKLNLLKILPRAIKVSLNGFLRLLTEKNYYWQNWLYDSLAEPLLELGKFYSKDK